MKKQLIFALAILLIGNNAHANNYETAGDTVQLLMPITAITMSYMENDREGRTQFYKSFGTTMAATYALKYSVNRTRPNGAPYSFPSGHTSASFSSATYIHLRYGYKKAVLPYIAATFVGWSRVEANKHYVSDVLAGAALGAFSSYFFTERKNTRVNAFSDGKALGIQFRYRW